jgi:4a-hydroxytetrahydrobiopterin dehydratase
MTTQVLSREEAALQLDKLKAWRLEAGELMKDFHFVDFRAALDFVIRVGKLAEEDGHHPDIEIHYNRVRLSLATHDAGGVTAKDFGLASRIEKLN